MNKKISIENLYEFASRLTDKFNEKGYPLVRVVVPSQELDSDDTTIFFKVVDGVIEKLDLRNVPPNQASRIYSYLKPLVKKKTLTINELNRRLILASSIAGINLTSGFLPGVTDGGTKLIIEASHKYISGSMEFNNFQSKALARQQGQMSLTINSPLGLGETISMFGLARPTQKGVNGSGRDVPIRAGGISMSVPLGNNGTVAGISYLESMTRPGDELESLSLEANMKSASLTLSHPLVYQPNKTWFMRGTVNWIDEIQFTNLTGKDEDISHDRLTNLRLGTSVTSCAAGCISFDAELSRGIELFSRSASEATSTPLSKESATSTYTHASSNISYSLNFQNNYLLNLKGGGQYTDDSLLNSEQASIIGEQKVSSLSSGAISGDKNWYARSQINKNINLSNELMVSPYLYSAMGVAYINKPSATEEKKTAAKSVGIGIEFNAKDKILFGKNIYGKAEYSKTWATKNIEQLSDVRLNNNHIAIKLAMVF
ncbi:MAG: hypothetical protein CMN48_00015 [SAR116 cluster bacterium]|nr:hypothetical protein [SAR116 cluster bacterium]RPG93842.1 MAG: ShlB/FhaC/HecB family hemolysin secretion/activation protein [Candidatus Puniceispirillum sp. TMED213]